jgi:protein tyrosine phosphatase (PTP) superfamily phosphohydrolase (DUF442 family)
MLALFRPVTIMLVFLLAIALGYPAEAAPAAAGAVDSPAAVPDREDMFLAGRMFFAGQPDEETLRWLSAEGVKIVINLRTDKEMADLLAKGFDEAALVCDLNMTYTRIPLGGDDGYPPAAVDELARLLRENRGKVLLHCRSAGRVTHLWMAYLVRHEGISPEEAVALGRKMKFSLAFEELLGQPLHYSLAAQPPQE